MWIMSIHNAAYKESTAFIYNIQIMSKYHSKGRSTSNFITINIFVTIIKIVFPNCIIGQMLFDQAGFKHNNYNLLS